MKPENLLPDGNIRTFSDGTVVEVVRKMVCKEMRYLRTDTYYHSTGNWTIVRVKTPCGRRFEFDEKHRALYWAALWSRTNGTRFVTDREVIPYKVAALGKPAIAVYLSEVHAMSIEEVADALEVAKQTVVQYRSDFISHRR